MQYAAFFADCEHELKPNRSGMRLVLAYNLVYTGPAAAAQRLSSSSSSSSSSAAELLLQRALRGWERHLDAGGTRRRIALLLEHKYAAANLRFEQLKGTDRTLAAALPSCPGLEAHLVLITRTVKGGTDSPWKRKKRRMRRQRGRWDIMDEEMLEIPSDYSVGRAHVMSEVWETRTETGKWVAMDGSCVDYGQAAFRPGDPADSEDYEAYTGNEGPELEQVYRKALLVLWPRSQSLAHAQRAGMTALLPLLKLQLAEATRLQQQQQQQPDRAAAAGSCRSDSAAAEVAAALQACVTAVCSPQVQQQQQQPSYSPYSYSSFSYSSKLRTQQAAVLRTTLRLCSSWECKQLSWA
uniref:Prolyl 4-hydroxylase alpha subunit Fe(2+) 2OG dioxygenase domain-containing protein n=1 Tax=Tetradesmus obliquus TaxID=3088 RepID=A0A383V4B8_TETOB|eukprot:jgi/Sobl393_1/447/SZX59760.1